MATNYKILGQGVNSLKIDAPANGSTIISELKIKNTSYPTNVDVMCSDEVSIIAELDSFNPNANSYVREIALQPDGKILIGGDFSNINGTTRNRIARLNSDGSLDTSFNPDANSTVYSIALQPDGKILISGFFTTIGGVTRNSFARLNSDGTLDTSFDPGNFNAGGSVSSIVPQPDGKIIIGGDFLSVGGVQRNRIARLNSDGTLDTAFNPNANYAVNSIALQPDNKILIVGSFTTIGGVSRGRVARLNTDGSLDTDFDPNANGYLAEIKIQPDGKILIGGEFNTVGDTTINNIARLNSDGTLDTSFDPGNFNAWSSVSSIVPQPDGKILIGGLFSTIGGVTRNSFARLNSDGTLDTGFNPNAGSSVLSIALQPDNKILIGGFFDTIGGVTRNYIARLFEYFSSENKDYIIKNKPLSYDEEIKISGGIALESGQSLVIETRSYDHDTVIIQAYGIEETA